MPMQDLVSQADVAAGLSLGEYTALTFAGALKCAHTSSLLQTWPAYQSLLCMLTSCIQAHWLMMLPCHVVL